MSREPFTGAQLSRRNMLAALGVAGAAAASPDSETAAARPGVVSLSVANTKAAAATASVRTAAALSTTARLRRASLRCNPTCQ